MDAISFVMGEKTSSLRVKRLSDLIHGASVGNPISRTASVTAVVELDDGNRTEKKFGRIVQGSSSEYRIDGDVSLYCEKITFAKKRRKCHKKNYNLDCGPVAIR